MSLWFDCTPDWHTTLLNGTASLQSARESNPCAPVGAWALSHGREPVEQGQGKHTSPGGATDSVFCIQANRSSAQDVLRVVPDVMSLQEGKEFVLER